MFIKIKNQKGLAHLSVIFAVVIVASVIGLAGWRVMSANNNQDSRASINTEQVEQEIELLPSDLENIKPISEIQALANQSGKEISGIELEFEDGILVYVINFSDGTKQAYNANTAEMVNYSSNDDDIDDSDRIPNNFNPNISIAQALEIALQQNPGVAIKKIEIELEGGIIVYSVRFVDDSRIDVSASNGVVVDQRTNDEDNNSSDRSSSDDDDDEDDDDEDDDDEDDDDEDDDEDDDDDRS